MINVPFPRFKLVFAWYDLWVGIYIDRKSGLIWVMPVPMFGFRIRYKIVETCYVKINIDTRELEKQLDDLISKLEKEKAKYDKQD